MITTKPTDAPSNPHFPYLGSVRQAADEMSSHGVSASCRSHLGIFTSLLIFAWGFAAPLCGKADIQYAGVNLAGGEFGELPGRYGTDYIYGNQREVDYFRSRGMNTIRLCLRWERLQPSTNANLSAAELSRLNAFVSPATAKGMYVILDPHNYGRYYNQTIGTPGVPPSAFSNFWWRVATVYRTNSHVIFGLMNEPHDMATSTRYATETWRDAAQAAIHGIRNGGATNLILVPGNGWSGAVSWLQNWYGTPNGTALLSLVDPVDNYAFEVHQYLDSEGSGTSTNIVSPRVGVDRLTAFTQWCKRNHRRGFLGEFAVANCTIGNGIGDETLTNMLAYVRSNSDVWLGWSWWSAGPWWGNYIYTLEPTGNYTVDQPAMAVLRHFLPVPAPALRTTGGGGFTFPTWPGFHYQPQYSVGLPGGEWIDLGTELPGNGQSPTVIMPLGGDAQFFRIRVRLGL